MPFPYFDRSCSSPDMAGSAGEKSAPFDLTPQSEFSSQESLLIETKLLTQVCSQTALIYIVQASQPLWYCCIIFWLGQISTRLWSSWICFWQAFSVSVGIFLSQRMCILAHWLKWRKTHHCMIAWSTVCHRIDTRPLFVNCKHLCTLPGSLQVIVSVSFCGCVCAESHCWIDALF